MRTFQEVQQDVNSLYKNLVQIADDIVKKNTENIGTTIKYVENNVEKLTNSDIRNLILKLSAMAFALGDKVEHADLKKECAIAIMKEAVATEFTSLTGTTESRRNTATLNTTNETSISMLYEAVSGLMKTKLQQTYRVIDSLKNVLISRQAEAKLQIQWQTTSEDTGVMNSEF